MPVQSTHDRDELALAYGPQANTALGMRRALMVRDLLVDAGLASAMIEVASHGEGDLLVHTPDETPDPRNRRVDITVR